jgi:hypothetical protein
VSLQQLSQLAQIVATIGGIVSLLFVASQIRHNTRVLERNEHNSTMNEWTQIRQTIVTRRDIAELMTAGLDGDRALDAADQLRLDQMLRECVWAAFHTWERTRRGVFPKGTFEATAGAFICDLLRTPRGTDWWQRSKPEGLVPFFVADMDRLIGVTPTPAQRIDASPVRGRAAAWPPESAIAFAASA